jgi:hypothetical protein
MPVERFKKVRDAVVDKVGDAKDAVSDKVGGAKDAVASKLAGPEDPYAELDPEAAAAARLADARAARQAELDAKALRGPAGAYLHGTVDGAIGMTTAPAVPPPTLEEGASLRQRFAASREWAKQMEQQVQQERARFAPPPPIRDVALRQQIADEERRIRDSFRFGYRSPDAWPVVILRFMVSADDQLGGVARVLAATGLAARPDLVYGVSRVPDRIGGKKIRTDDGVVEWEITHASLDPLTPIEAQPDIVWFDGTETWVARAAGDPSVLDEDLVLALSATTGIPPEQSLGIARLVTTDVHAGDDAAPTVRAVVRGVALFHRNQTARGAIEEFQGLRWMILPPGPPPGVHVEVLNWAAVAAVVHRDSHDLAEIPSRFAYLPSTPQELLTAYLEVVGVWPGDCWSAQTTRDQPGNLLQAGASGGDGGWDERVRGEPLPCADGVLRRRVQGTTLVVVAYRDRPSYAEGRERWDAYQRDILQADLRLETGSWRPVQDGLHPGVPKLFKGAAKALDTVEKVASWEDRLTLREGVDFKPHRYCWPPTTGE